MLQMAKETSKNTRGNGRLDARLAAYAAATAAVLSPSAQATIIGSDVGFSITNSASTTSSFFSLDMDGGAPEVTFSNWTTTSGSGWAGLELSAHVEVINSDTFYSTTGFPQPAQLSLGATVSSGKSFGGGGTLFYEYYGYGNFAPGEWGYLGIRFDSDLATVGSQWHYGWIHVMTTGKETKIDGWAYEDSGASIRAGDMPTPVPEPGSLGLLALGAAGLTAMRRNRKNQGHVR